MAETAPHDWFRRLRAQGLASRQRRVVLLQGRVGWCRDTVAMLPTALNLEAARWLGDPPIGWKAFAGTVGEALGRELDLIGLDLRAGLDADLFGALSGSLRAGGLLLLSGPHLPDGLASSRFMSRAARLLAQAPEAISLAEGEVWPSLANVGAPTAALQPDDLGCLTVDQRRAVAAVQRVATGHRRRPAVLTADRGRGKSAAFGLAAASLLRTRGARVLVTGPSLGSVASVFAAAASPLSGARIGRGVLQEGGAELRFVAPDALVREPLNADLLLVDEAAALPVGLLTRLLACYARIAFATTVHGYEGSGRAFALRFAGILDQRTPGWRALTLNDPVRWAAGDPLEALSARLLLLDAEPAVAWASTGDCRVERIERDRLLGDEALLRELFGLLILAHYRTRPGDLQQWLDGEGFSLWELRCGDHVAGVAIAAREGGLSPALAAAVGRGQRRARGHLLAQTLAAHLGFVQGAGQRGLRIVRIAVHPTAQGRGLGGRLLREVIKAAQAEGLDWIGASFGTEAGLLRFWQAGGFTPIRLGFTHEASSGAHALLMMRGLSAAGEALTARATQRFARGLPTWLSDPLRDLEPELALALLASARAPDEPVRQEARRFAHGEVDCEDALPWLRELCLARLGECWRGGLLNREQAEVLLVKLIQAHPWAETATQLGVPGRAQVIALLREAVAVLLTEAE